jgi:enoyl-CoA hydratase/carnithine racemase
MMSIVRLPKPVIAEVHGTATAAGCQLVATCDLAVAAEDARFATPGVNIGLFCTTPMVALTRAVGPKAAMEMLLTGEAVSAAEALRIGLVNRVVPAAGLAAETAALAVQIAAKSALALAMGKDAFHRQAGLGLAEAYDLAADVMTRNMMARDAAEGIDAFLEKRPPSWRDA